MRANKTKKREDWLRLHFISITEQPDLFTEKIYMEFYVFFYSIYYFCLLDGNGKQMWELKRNELNWERKNELPVESVVTHEM